MSLDVIIHYNLVDMNLDWDCGGEVVQIWQTIYSVKWSSLLKNIILQTGELGQINPGDLQITTAVRAEGGSRLGFICFPTHWVSAEQLESIFGVLLLLPI